MECLILAIGVYPPMRHDTGKDWRPGGEHQHTRRSGFGLLYCIVTQPLRPEHCIDQVGEQDVDS